MNRRGFLRAMLAAGAAPAIVRASSLMPLWVPKAELIVPEVTVRVVQGNTLLTIDQITREALRVLHKNLLFTSGLNSEYDQAFDRADTLTIRVPQPYRVRS